MELRLEKVELVFFFTTVVNPISALLHFPWLGHSMHTT